MEMNMIKLTLFIFSAQISLPVTLFAPSATGMEAFFLKG
jgi:hypothetical protein